MKHPFHVDWLVKWVAILIFMIAPWGVVYTIVMFGTDLPTEVAIKIPILEQRSDVDTVVIGDSKVLRVAEEPFAKNGWHYFNMGLTAISPTDSALELNYVLSHQPIKRVVLGVCLEGMAESYASEFCNWANEPAFRDPRIRDSIRIEQAPDGHKAKSQTIRESFENLRTHVLPIDLAAEKLHGTLVAWRIEQPRELFRHNGTYIYDAVEAQIASGTYDFEKHRNPHYYFNQDRMDKGLLTNRKLAEHAKQLYIQIFQKLRSRGIPTVVYETGRSQSYMKLVKSNPLLSKLQDEWQDFFREQSFGCIKFLDFIQTLDCYDEDDFFDPVHFIGKTEGRLGARLATTLAELEQFLTKSPNSK